MKRLYFSLKSYESFSEPKIEHVFVGINLIDWNIVSSERPIVR